MSARRHTRLREELEESHRQAERPRQPGFPVEALGALQHFQRERLARTYADLAAQRRYADAVAFFLEELYGGKDMQVRDRQVADALPIMQRTLPSRMQEALADAFRLQALSLELDIVLAQGMAEEGLETITPADYSRLYPRVPRERRVEQIELIENLAGELDRVVNLPLVLGLIVAMRGPARAAGFGDLQAFLERGLRAFRTMGSAERFSRVIVDRERRIMERLYAGEPRPFDLQDQNSQPK